MQKNITEEISGGFGFALGLLMVRFKAIESCLSEEQKVIYRQELSHRKETLLKKHHAEPSKTHLVKMIETLLD